MSLVAESEIIGLCTGGGVYKIMSFCNLRAYCSFLDTPPVQSQGLHIFSRAQTRLHKDFREFHSHLKLLQAL